MKNTRILAVITVLFLLAVVVSACDIVPQGCEHEWLDATCTEPKTCNICAETEGEPLGHKEETVAGNAATCTESGLTEGKKCSACGEVLLAQEVIPANGHKDEDSNYVCDVCEADLCTSHIPSDAVKENEVAPTCSKEGSYELVVRCSACNEEISRETKTVEMLDHTEGEATRENEVAPTCEGKGSYDEVVKCSVCEKELSRTTVEVDALGHTEGEATRENDVTPTCEGKGSYDMVVKCSVCEKELSRTTLEVDSLGHTEGEAARENEVAPTCSKEGSYDEVVKCSVCEKELSRETKSVAKLAHTEETVAGKAATCTETGLTDGKKCSVCGESLLAQEVIAALGHKDENGDYKCDACGTDLCTDHIPADAIEENRVESTCTVAGSYESVVKCSRCGEEISRETKALPLADHTEEVIPAVKPDCVNTGLTEGKRCSVCGATTVAQSEVAAYGHSEEIVAGVAPTCTKAGLTEGKKCSTCGETLLAQQEIAMLSHEYDNGVVEGTKKTYTCVNGCESTKVVYLVTVNYLYLDGTVAAEADVYEYDDNYIYTINAKAVDGYVASHDYVKGHILGAGGTITIYYSQVDVWDGTSVSESLSGAGTAEDPYLIQSAADFVYLAGQLNAAAVGTTQNFQGQYVKMTKSIDLNGNLLIAGNHSGWNKYQGFGGTFDGNNCTIRGINVNPTTGTSSGLFGCITKAGTLKNLVVYGNASGAATVGGVVAYQLGKVDNVTSYVTVTATGGTIGGVVANQESSAGALTNCVNYGSVTSATYIVGGVAGSGGATITNCVNWGAVQGGSEVLGGIAGTTKNKGTISGCYNYGSVTTTATDKGYIGGIAGKCLKPVSDCYNFGTITGVNTTGGIVGSTDSAITNCVNYGTVNATSWNIGGIAGTTTATAAAINGCTNYGDITSTGDCVGGIVGAAKALVSDCQNYGTIKGTGRSAGIAYWSNNTIENCVNNGEIIGGWDLGGILAYVGDGVSATITNCTNNGNITGTWNNGGIFGLAHDNAGAVTITGCTNNGHIKSTTGGQISIAVKAVITECTENGSWTKAE